MTYPTTLVLGEITRVALQDIGPYGGHPENAWALNINGVYYDSSTNPGGYNVTFIEDIEMVVGGTTRNFVVVDVYIIPGATSIGNPITPILFHTRPGSGQDQYQKGFTASCFNLYVEIAQLNTIPDSTPGQYIHRYSVRAATLGGDSPFTYTWGTPSITGPGIVSVVLGIYSSDHSTCLLEVTNTTKDFSGITGTVSCSAVDNNGCSASGSANVEEATPPGHTCGKIQPYGPIPSYDSSASRYSCPSSSLSQQCKQTSGNNTVSGGGDRPGSFQRYGGGTGSGASPLPVGSRPIVLR